MGHEAIAAWLMEEVGSRVSVLPGLYRAIDRLNNCELWEYILDGEEYNLKLTRTEAGVVNARVDFDSSFEDDFGDIGDEMDFYDEESRASCGLDDFKAMLEEWERFISR